MSRFELKVGDRLVFSHWEEWDSARDLRPVVRVGEITADVVVGVAAEQSWLLVFSDGSYRWCHEEWLERTDWSLVEIVSPVPDFEPKYSREQIVRMFT